MKSINKILAILIVVSLHLSLSYGSALREDPALVINAISNSNAAVTMEETMYVFPQGIPPRVSILHYEQFYKSDESGIAKSVESHFAMLEGLQIDPKNFDLLKSDVVYVELVRKFYSALDHNVFLSNVNNRLFKVMKASTLNEDLREQRTKNYNYCQSIFPDNMWSNTIDSYHEKYKLVPDKIEEKRDDV